MRAILHVAKKVNIIGYKFEDLLTSRAKISNRVLGNHDKFVKFVGSCNARAILQINNSIQTVSPDAQAETN